jgi:exosortase
MSIAEPAEGRLLAPRGVGPVETGRPRPGDPSPVAAAAIVVLLLAGPFPMLVQLGRSLWEREQYQFFPLMIVGAAAVAWDRWQDLPRRSLRRGSPAVAGALLALALLVLAMSAALWVRSMSLVATLFILTAIAWRAGGPSLLRTLWPSLVLLAIIVPPPTGQEQLVTLRLQHLAVTVSCRLLDVLRVANMQAGNVIEIPGRRLLVEQACSGINSLMAVLAFTLLYGFYLRRPLRRLAVLLPVAVLFVLGGNVVRITAEAWMLVQCHVDVTGGFSHQLLGLALFGACVALVASMDALLGGAAGGPPAPRPAAAVGGGSPPVSLATWPAWVAAATFAVAGTWIGARVWHAWASPTLAESATFDLPPSVAGWQQVTAGAMYVERPQTEAAKSTVWQFRRDDAFASVALDYPFTGYHELTTCYHESGWTVRSEAADPAEGLTRATMAKPDGDAYLLFTQVNESGRPVGSVPAPDPRTLWGRLYNRLAIVRQVSVSERFALGGASYQVQVLLQSAGVPTAEQRRAADELFHAVRGQLTTQLLAQLGGAK